MRGAEREMMWYKVGNALHNFVRLSEYQSIRRASPSIRTLDKRTASYKLSPIVMLLSLVLWLCAGGGFT
jgi:hypothetical protein